MKRYLPLLFFVAMFLVFDLAYSLLSTCQPIHSAQPGNSDYQNYCTLFGGIFVTFILIPIAYFLKIYEHELIAGFTIVLALSTIGLWLSTRHLWEVTKAAVDLANKEFLSSHRPRMRLKHAWFTDQTA